MFDPAKLSVKDRHEIKTLFEPLTQRQVLPLEEELESPDRKKFDEAVFSAYSIEALLPQVKKSLLDLYRIRKSVKN